MAYLFDKRACRLAAHANRKLEVKKGHGHPSDWAERGRDHLGVQRQHQALCVDAGPGNMGQHA